MSLVPLKPRGDQLTATNYNPVFHVSPSFLLHFHCDRKENKTKKNPETKKTLNNKQSKPKNPTAAPSWPLQVISVRTQKTRCCVTSDDYQLQSYSRYSSMNMQTGMEEDCAEQTPVSLKWCKLLKGISSCHCIAIFANLQKAVFQKSFLEQLIPSKHLTTKGSNKWNMP